MTTPTPPAPHTREPSALVDRYFEHVPAEQLREIDTAAVLAAHCELAESRPVGRAVARVHPPAPRWPGATPVLQVVTDDMPYLVESLTSVLTESGMALRQVIHPVLVVRRGLAGELLEVLADAQAHEPPVGAVAESWMHFEIEPGAQDRALADLQAHALALLSDVRDVMEDTEKMRAAQLQLATDLDNAVSSGTYPEREVREAAELLRWLADGHFTMLGYRRYDVSRRSTAENAAGLVQRAVLGSGWGRCATTSWRNAPSRKGSGPRDVTCWCSPSRPRRPGCCGRFTPTSSGSSPSTK